MLALIWAELDALMADVRVLQYQLVTARLTGDAKLAQIFSKELERTLRERDNLVSRIGTCIGAGEAAEPLELAA